MGGIETEDRKVHWGVWQEKDDGGRDLLAASGIERGREILVTQVVVTAGYEWEVNGEVIDDTPLIFRLSGASVTQSFRAWI